MKFYSITHAEELRLPPMIKLQVFALDRDFARVAKQVEAVAAVTPDDFQEFFERFFVSGHKRKVVSQVGIFLPLVLFKTIVISELH